MYGALWRSKNKRDGESRHLIMVDCLPVLFTTRRAAAQWIKKNYGYIATRRDLRAEPHGWRVPIAVKVQVEVTTQQPTE